MSEQITESARKPGEFRVGDRVRVTYAITASDEKHVGQTYTVDQVVTGCGVGVEELLSEAFTYTQIELIEHPQPAREGDVVGSAHGAENRARAESPPAPSADSESYDPVEYFRSVLWPKVPPAFPLGQRKEPVVRREPCPTCHEGRIFFPDTRQVADCPECAGSGWQEVR